MSGTKREIPLLGQEGWTRPKGADGVVIERPFSYWLRPLGLALRARLGPFWKVDARRHPSSMRRGIRFLLLNIVLSGLVSLGYGQQRVVTGGMNSEFTVSNQDRSIAFYRDVLGLGDVTGRTNPALPG